MEEVYYYSYVEDAPSAAVARKLFEYRNLKRSPKICFMNGFPAITRGFGELRKKCPKLLEMTRAGIHTFCITDLDSRPCPGELIRDWFEIHGEQHLVIPKTLLFRVAVREVEAWIMADRSEWARHIGIPAECFPIAPDTLADPKQHLLNTVRRKGKRILQKKMLPEGTAHVGPCYNDVLCDFVRDKWSPGRASKNSPSLARAVESLLSC